MGMGLVRKKKDDNENKPAGSGSMASREWLIEALQEILDDYGRHPEEQQMTTARIDEIRAVVYNDPSLQASPPQTGDPGAISVGDIIRRCNDAASHMSPGNDHRNLIILCAHALSQLVNRLDTAERMLQGRPH